jgi:hypothetical protein
MDKLTRSVFFKMPDTEKHHFLDRVRGGEAEIIDDPPPTLPKASSLDPEKQISRAAFQGLGVLAKSATIKRGIEIVDTLD